MTEPAARWRPTAGLGRALATAAMAVALALLAGEPSLVVLAVPFVALAVPALLLRPRREPRLSARLDHRVLHEGQGTTSRLSLTEAEDVEFLTRVVDRTPYVSLQPDGGRVGGLRPGPDDPAPVVEIGPQRWGRPVVGGELVVAVGPWAGHRFGPVALEGRPLTVLPAQAPYNSRAEAPQPLGLVGAHRSRRPGSGTELAGIRPFQPGDRLRRVNWRVSLRTRVLNVVSTRAEEDTGVLLVVDALADHGRSGGVGGAASSLDVSVRAASAIAEHHVRTGDRVALRVVGRGGELVGYGTGARHLQRLQHTLATIRPGRVSEEVDAGVLRLGVTGGTVVILLSPMLAGSIGAVAATLTMRGVGVLVVDTLPPDVRPAVSPDTDPAVGAVAWRMRRLERSLVLERLAGLGCPVVAWRGPGTVDDVLRRLARRAQLPRVVAR